MIIIDSTSYQLNPIAFNAAQHEVSNSCTRQFELNKLFPFQLPLTSKATSLTATLTSCEGTVLNVTTKLKEAGLKVINPGVNRWNVIFPAKFVLNLGLPAGVYTLQVKTDKQEFNSAKFSLVEAIPSIYTKLTWGNNTSGDGIAINGGIISFADDFEFYMFLDLAVTNTENTLTEDVNNRDGVQFPSKMVSELTYNTTDFTADPALIDCLRLVNMCDDISLENKGVKYVIQDILFTPKWRTAGSLIADVSCEFSLGNYIKRIGFDYTKQYQGDFNNDFNNDYKK